MGMLMMFHKTFFMYRSNVHLFSPTIQKLHADFELLPCCFPFHPQLSSYTVSSTGFKVIKGNTDMMIVSCVLVTETGFGFVIGFINHSQVANYNYL
jgi:hypothetical protein